VTKEEKRLRDWFAGQALQGIIASCGEGESINPTITARFVFEVADAMLAERAKAPTDAPHNA